MQSTVFWKRSSRRIRAIRLHVTAKSSSARRNLMGNAPNKEMISASAALPGRAAAMRFTNAHYVLKNKLSGPYEREGLKTAVFATGCFWGSEKGFWRLPGVHSTAVGYFAGFTPNPTYEEVCSGRIAHGGRARRVRPKKNIVCRLAETLLAIARSLPGNGSGER